MNAMSDDLNLSTPAPDASAELTFAGGAADDQGAAPAVAAVTAIPRGKIDRFGVAWGTGRRKTSVARVRLTQGTGKVTVNGRPLDQYFCIERDQALVLAPLRAVERQDSLDVTATVEGGGTTGQAGALLLGIARALDVLNPSLHATLGEGGFLTRDSRMVERKKYGFKKARRSFQFSKR
jgi:small subunit ribosomal protein S9